MNCSSCKKSLSNENKLFEIRGCKGNQVIAYLCEKCYDKYIKLKQRCK